MDISIVYMQLFVLFSLMAVGFALRRLKILDDKANDILTHLVLKVALPATIVMGITGASGVRENVYLLYVIGVSFLVYIVLGLLAVISSRLIRAKTSEDVGAFANISMFGNVAYLGIPLTIALFGPESVFYAVLFNLVSNLIAFSIGIKLLGGSKAKFAPKLIFNTLMNISLVAIVLFLLDVQIPALIQMPLTHLRNMLTPMGMILLGSILGGMDMKEVFLGWRIYVAIAFKLLLAPVAVFLLLSQFITNPVMLSIFVLLSASPTAPRTAMLCLRYGGNFKLVSQGIFLGTMLSVVTIPLLIHLLGL